MRHRFLVSLMIVFPLAGCAREWDSSIATPPGGTGIAMDGTVANGNEALSTVSRLPSRDTRGTVAPFGSQGQPSAYEFSTGYKIGAGDRLTIRVAGETDLTADYLVDGSGNISMPYVQTINVGARTSHEVEQMITGRLRHGYLRNPQVSVQVTSLRPFYILGEVNTAGSFSYQPGMTVQNAVAIAGGYGPRADRGIVLLTRKNAKGTATYKAPLTTQIYPGDIIYVRERWF